MIQLHVRNMWSMMVVLSHESSHVNTSDTVFIQAGSDQFNVYAINDDVVAHPLFY